MAIDSSKDRFRKTSRGKSAYSLTKEKYVGTDE